MILTDAQELIEEGRQEGLQEGVQEGLRKMLQAQLEFKFGSLSEGILKRLHDLSEPELSEAGRQLLNAKTLEELGL